MQKQKYTKEEIQAGVKFLQNKNVNFDYDKDDMQISFNIDVGCRIWTDGSSIWSRGVVKGVKVSALSLNATHSKEMYAEEDWDKLKDEDLYWSGGLTGYAHYDGTGKDGTWYDGIDDESALINRNTSKESDGLIYTDNGFTKNLLKYLRDECDFDTHFVDLTKYLDFDYSEQGMQTEESVNFDVQMDGDFWIKCNEELTKFAVGEEQVA
tara:strand:+ start:1182 stop:1808 length:627 start_codon:yes stop_codon:yes gene_type:complete